MPEMDIWGVTHVGRVRKNNEDAFKVEKDLSLVIVADGMGGAACGEVASEITVNTIVEYVRHPTEERCQMATEVRVPRVRLHEVGSDAVAGQRQVARPVQGANHEVMSANQEPAAGHAQRD